MQFKILGYVIWRIGKWYARRRLRGARRKVTIAAVSATVLAGVGVAVRSAGAGEDA